MPISLAELKAMLDVDEPDYPALSEAAAGAVRHLRKLAASADVSLASKAVSLAGIMGDADCIAIVGSASKSRDVLVRVAAAHAASLLPASPEAARLVSKLLDDRDVGVVKLAARAATRLADPVVTAKARRASARMNAAVRAAAAKQRQQERSTTMATKAAKKAGGTAGRAGATRKRRSGPAATQMPTGTMTEPPKGKARKMPSGEMS
jgi:cell division septum initiation protein DivIVA